MTDSGGDTTPGPITPGPGNSNFVVVGDEGREPCRCCCCCCCCWRDEAAARMISISARSRCSRSLSRLAVDGCCGGPE